jgi:phospholipid/cholesterol/gamma-HCH transport system ATP-binding protein
MNASRGNDSILKVSSIHTRFGNHLVHRGVSFALERGTITALIGGSGCGKSTLLREILRLQRPAEGEILLFGQSVWGCSEKEIESVRQRIGVLFQQGALFSALTVGENIAVPLREQAGLRGKELEEVVQLRLGMVGLEPQTARLFPSELSGGMIKRVALARALALEPEMLFLDEPTSGLDPISARAFDVLVNTLSDNLGLTVLMVTHDLDSLESIADRLIVLEDGVVLADGSVADVKKVRNKWIETYFSSRTGMQ